MRHVLLEKKFTSNYADILDTFEISQKKNKKRPRVRRGGIRGVHKALRLAGNRRVDLTIAKTNSVDN